MRKVLFLFMYFFFANSCFSEDSRFDINGIELGMTLSEVKSILTELNYKPVESKRYLYAKGRKKIPDTEHVFFIKGFLKSSNLQNSIVVNFAEPPNNHVVSYINSHSSYKSKKGPKLASLLASLEDKYNKVSHTQTVRESINYTWSAAENISPPCLTWSQALKSSPFKKPDYSLDVNDLISNVCGLTLNVQVHQQDKLVKNVSSRVYDSNMLKKQRDSTKKLIESYTEKIE